MFPPLSSGYASVVRPRLRFHIPLIEPDMALCRLHSPASPPEPATRAVPELSPSFGDELIGQAAVVVA
jgi:hypothetical protein